MLKKTKTFLEDNNFFDKTKKCSNVIEGINQDIPQYNGDKEGQHDEHPTQKPIKLLIHLLNIHSEKGMTVLDPFMGSGTTGVACSKIGRNFIGIELLEKYYNVAKLNIENEENQIKLF
jgi:DNA modification methylase